MNSSYHLGYNTVFSAVRMLREVEHAVTTAPLRVNIKKLRGLYSVSELYRPSDRRLSEKLVSSLADGGCRMVSATDSHGR
jgi:hypothetical protein